MGNRIIKESICTSDNLDHLSWFEEVCFYRLIVNCDDFGRMDARPAILRARLFPLKNVTDKQIENALESLRSAAMIDLYTVDGRSFLQMRTWERHQSIRAKRSKYPAPESEKKAVDSTCEQMKSDESKCPRNPIQFESESEFDPNPSIYTEPSPASVPEATPPAFQILLNDKTLFDITEDMLRHWAELYPAVDVRQEMRNIVGWCEANPSKRKTRGGAMRFLNSWLAKAQNQGGARQKGGERSGAVSSLPAASDRKETRSKWNLQNALDG